MLKRPLLALILLLPLTAGSSSAEVFLAQDEALQTAFEADRVERRTFILTSAQIARIEKRARSPIEDRIVTFHVGVRDDQVIGYAHISSQRVRTHHQTIMVVFSPTGTITKTLILAFHEPLEYLASKRWLDQFTDRSDPERIEVGTSIHGIVGSTLTTAAVSSGVRLSLTLLNELVLQTSADGG